MTAVQPAFNGLQQRNALLAAVLNGNLAKVEALLDDGADPNEKYENGDTPVIMAAARGHVEIVKLLLERGADIAAKNYAGYSALHAAVSEEKAEAARLLVERGAPLDEQRQGHGNNPLIEAVNKGNAEIVRLLIDNLADLNKTNRSRNTAVEIARIYGLKEIAQMLEDAPARQAQILRERAEAKRFSDMHARTASHQQKLQRQAQARRIKPAGPA